MNTEAWKLLDEDKANPQPTPPIPTLVTWYQAGDVRNAQAAIVTGHGDRPGRINLCIFAPGAFPQHRKGVYHVTSRHNKPNSQTIRDAGTWDYPKGTKILNSHYEAHTAEMTRREQGLVEHEQKAREITAKVQVVKAKTELGAA